MGHPGEAHVELVCPENCPPQTPTVFGVALLGFCKGRKGVYHAVCTVEAHGRLAAEVMAGHMAGRLMPKTAGWSKVEWRVSTGVSVDPRRVMLGEDEG